MATAGVATGKVTVDESVRNAGMTVLDQVFEREQYEIKDLVRHVDGTDAIAALARRAEEAGVKAR